MSPQRNSPAKGFSLKTLVMLALLVALAVIFKRFLGYNDKVLSLSFGFVPIAMAGMLFGPMGGLIAGALADVVGALLFPFGAFNPLFTLVQASTGLIYGFFLHPQGTTKQRIALAQLCVSVLLYMLANTLILVPIVGKGFMALLPLRALKILLFFPVEVFVLIKMVEYRRAFEGFTK